jgi:membrane protease YdiL (CAAX protease family)
VSTAKPWKAEAILRFFIRVLICMCVGWLVLGLISPQANQSHTKQLAVTAAAAVCFGVAVVLLGKPWSAENFFSRGLVALILFYAGLAITFTMGTSHAAHSAPRKISVAQMAVTMLSLQGSAVVLVTFFLREQGTSWKEAFGLANNTKRAVLIGLLAALLFLPVASVLKVGSEKTIEYVTHKPAEQQEAIQVIENATGLPYKILLGFFTLIVAPLGEEVLFRGILYTAIKQAGFPQIAFWLSSIAFAGIHATAGIFLPLFVLALMLARLYDKTGNLLAPISAHAAFNLAGYLFTLHQSG